MNRLFLEGSYQAIQLQHVPMAFSTTILEVGGFQWRKILRLLNVVFGILRVRFFKNTGILYYPPAGPNWVPFLRDCAILISTRWLFAKTVFHFHANGISKFHDSLSPFWKWLYRLAYHKPDLCICLSQATQVDAIQMQSRKIEIVPNGIPDLSLQDARQLQATQPRPRILFLSNISLEKGAGTLIEALALLKERGCACGCTIGGPFASADEEDRIRRLARERNLETDIDWAGPLNPDQKSDQFRRSDIFCFPTHYHAEGQPLVLLEAMMFSLPIVATDWRGIPDNIENGKNGFLVPIQSPESLAQILEKLIKEPELRKSMGREGRKRYCENHTAEKFRQNMEAALSQFH